MSVHTDDIVIANTPLPVDPSGVTSPVNVQNFPATQPVSAVSLPLPSNAAQETGGHLASIDTKLTAPIQTISAVASTSTITQVVLTNNTNVQALAANANRKKAIIFAPKSILYIKLGTTASTTSFTYQLTTNNSTVEITGWTGEIDVISNTGQTINVTELS